MLYLFLLIVGALAAGAYILFIFSNVPGAKEERLGVWEPIPEQLGQWVTDAARSAEGWLREQRILYDEKSGGGAGQFIVQVRYRDPDTQEIQKIEPEQIRPRRRVKLTESATH